MGPLRSETRSIAVLIAEKNLVDIAKRFLNLRLFDAKTKELIAGVIAYHSVSREMMRLALDHIANLNQFGYTEVFNIHATEVCEELLSSGYKVTPADLETIVEGEYYRGIKLVSKYNPESLPLVLIAILRYVMDGSIRDTMMALVRDELSKGETIFPCEWKSDHKELLSQHVERYPWLRDLLN